MLHVHLQVPVIPPTISDQIRLWELERDRLDISEGNYNIFSLAGNVLMPWLVKYHWYIKCMLCTWLKFLYQILACDTTL